MMRTLPDQGVCRHDHRPALSPRSAIPCRPTATPPRVLLNTILATALMATALGCASIGTRASPTPDGAAPTDNGEIQRIPEPRRIQGLPIPPMARPNVLFIVLDDANDWITPLGGHPDARTPHLERLAAAGTIFEAAYADAPACNPSRTAVLTGRKPHSSGVYFNGQPFRTAMPRVRTLPESFQRAGYHLYGAGKVYHGAREEKEGWDRWYRQRIDQRPLPAEQPAHGIEGMAEHVDWGEMVSGTERDPLLARWAARQLGGSDLQEPFLLAVGLHRPHMPWYLPKSHWEAFAPDTVTLPDNDIADLQDVPERVWQTPERELYDTIDAAGQSASAVAAYLGALGYADEQLGTILDGLEASPYARRTVVVVWSDHGFHLGEKRRFGKYSLWREALRVPLLLSGPGIPAGHRVSRPVQLADLYPTLAQLCQLPQPRRIDGRSLLPLLTASGNTAPRGPALSTYGPGNHALHWRHWSYIRYADGSEELYDLRVDEAQRHNLVVDPSATVETLLQRLRQHLPQKEAKPSPSYADVGFEPRERDPNEDP